MESRRPSKGRTAALLAASIGLLGLLASGVQAFAEEQETDDEEQVVPDRRVLGSDPSEIVSRLEVRNEYLHDAEGHADTTIFRGDWAPADWILGRVEIPLVSAKSEELGSTTGLGDVLVGLRGKKRLAEEWSVLAEMAAYLDTATADELGAGLSVLAPPGVVVWKPSPPWILGLQYQWFGSVGGGDGLETIRESAFRPQVLWHLPRGFWLLADPRIYVNHVEGTQVAFFPTGEFGNVVAEHVEVWIRGGGNATGGGRLERTGWGAEAGVRYLFD